MRTLTPAARTKSLTPKGTFPIVILEIRWTSGIKYYSEIDHIFNGQTCEVSIIKLGDFTSSGKIGSKGEVSSVDFELDDTSGSLKTKINTEIIEGTVGVVWHHYNDLASNEATVMHYGKIAGPIKWNEEERIFSATLESIQGKGEIGFSPSDDINNPNYVAGLLPECYNTPWPIIFGSPKQVPIVKIHGPTEADPAAATQYIVGVYGSYSVSRVMAKRQCYGNKEDDFFIVSPSNYSVSDSALGGKNITILTCSTPLSLLEGFGWEDDLYVDISGGLTSNPIEQIRLILSNFTDLLIDNTSFNAASGLMSDTPAHHVLFDQQDAVPLCEKIAWQARCLLFIKSGTAYIRPLFVNSVTDASITLNEAKLKSMELSFTDTEDIVTVFNATWKQDYSGHKEAEQKTIIKTNVDTYGVISEDYDFFIYTTQRAVQIASSFWSYRYANSWRKASVGCFLPALNIEAYDCVQFNHPTLSTYAIRGFAESVKHDIETNIISIEAELGSKAGDHTGGQPIEDSRYWLGGDNPTNGYTTPVGARAPKATCVPLKENELEDEEDLNAGGIRIYIENGSGYAYAAHEIYWVEKDVLDLELMKVVDIAHVGAPREDNIESGQILFTKETIVGHLGWGFPAGENVWCDYNLNPDVHPNYFDSPTTKEGDNVGVKAGYQYLSKDRSGFKVTGVDGGKVSVVAGSVDPKLEKIYSTDSIPAYSPAEIYGYDEDRTLVRKPTADSIPPGRLIFPITDIPANSNGKGYNAFDVSPFVTSAEPSEPGAEFGTIANSFELAEGNTGFVALGRKGGRNQYRPF